MLGLILACASQFGCDGARVSAVPDASTEEDASHASPGVIDPSALAVGQKTRYRVLLVEDIYASSDAPAVPTDFVLVMEILSGDEGGFVVRAGFEAPLEPDDLPILEGWDLTAQYTMRVNGSALEITSGDALDPWLFPGAELRGALSLPLDPTLEPETTLDGWRTEALHSGGWASGTVSGATIQDTDYAQLNLILRDESDLDGALVQYLYSRRAGIVRVFWSLPESGRDGMILERLP